MRRTLKIDIDEELLNLTANCFGYSDKINYSKLIEQALLYFLKPQINYSQTPHYAENKKIQELLIEPIFDIDTIENDYHFDLASVEGKWPGNESVEQLIGMLSK